MDAGRLRPLLRNIGERLKDPLQLRVVAATVLLGAWYTGVYTPLSESLAATTRERAAVVSHTALARDIQAFRVEVEKFRPRLPTGTDANEWVEYVLAGIREQPVRLLKLEPQGTRKLGPYAVIVLRIELAGRYADLARLLAWIESNRRLLRIDTFAIDPTRGAEGGLVLKLTVLGVMG